MNSLQYSQHEIVQMAIHAKNYENHMFIKYAVQLHYLIKKAIEKYNSAICYDFNLDKNELCLQLNFTYVN